MPKITKIKLIRKCIECDRSKFPTENLLSCAKKFVAFYLKEIIAPIENSNSPHKTALQHVSKETK